MMDKVFMQTAYRNKEGKDILVNDEPGKLINAIADRPLIIKNGMNAYLVIVSK